MNISAYNRLVDSGLRPSTQRLAIMSFLLTHRTHPTVEDVYQGVVLEVPTLSRTTVYNTLRLLSENGAAQMITIDDHHVCYDGDTHPHVHFLCRKCCRVYDLMNEKAPRFKKAIMCDGNIIDEAQLYYKGVCKECLKNEKTNEDVNCVLECVKE